MDDTLLISESLDKTIKIWKISDGTLQQTIRCSSEGYCVAVPNYLSLMTKILQHRKILVNGFLFGGFTSKFVNKIGFEIFNDIWSLL